MPTAPGVTVVSLEAWDDVWRRNQYFVRALREQDLAGEVLFLEPPRRGRSTRGRPLGGVTTVRPRLVLPKRAGGLRFAARGVASEVARTSILWVNDATVGLHLLRSGVRTVYDVTDDWRASTLSPRARRRLISAEDELARRAATVVCSEELRRRWSERYGVEAAVVPNGIDAAAWAQDTEQTLPGHPPHVGYVGTLHADRLDIGLVRELGTLAELGTVHLIGPDALDEQSRALLLREPKVRMWGPIDARSVPEVTRSLDLLVSPHRVSSFTDSLDAIKSREYFASRRPIVATPTSGFDRLSGDGIRIVQRDEFLGAVLASLASDVRTWRRAVPDEWSWDARARQFAHALELI
ncbi:glycosyltransferase [Humibacter sp.]|uniref:glycosyltransferase n=1 Tax=Humibacter sp. TaxID=1940291 RepID=UPI002B8F6DD7|nr:glycosyltransferase [Humibacter sp.]HVX07915.1 glycosyltransferase [Humibacter sp.]